MSKGESEGRGSLERTILEIRRVLREHHEYLRGNETATRALVIDVVLERLGWNIRDPARVRLEYRVNGNKVDYVLMTAEKRPLAVVEAKAADTGTKGKDQRDATGYAAEMGARYAVLTNGGRWEAWEMGPAPRRDNILLEVNLTTGDAAEIASKLEGLRRGRLGG